jgi:hypothetical protein
LNRCIVSNNTAYSGGGIYESTLNNCLVVSNTGLYYGGGTYGGTLNNCTVVGNNGVGAYGYYFGHSGTLCTLNNTIVYYNTLENLNGFAGLYSMDHSCSTPAWYGSGNITNEPGFVDLSGANFRLQGSSPCINAGNNTLTNASTDLDGNPRIVGGKVDMGAYEFQAMQPVLRIAPSGSYVTLAWPAWAGDFELQEAGAPPSTAAGWSNLTVNPFVTNNESTVTLPVNGAQIFYRLFKP